MTWTNNFCNFQRDNFWINMVISSLREHLKKVLWWKKFNWAVCTKDCFRCFSFKICLFQNQTKNDRRTHQISRTKNMEKQQRISSRNHRRDSGSFPIRILRIPSPRRRQPGTLRGSRTPLQRIEFGPRTPRTSSLPLRSPTRECRTVLKKTDVTSQLKNQNSCFQYLKLYCGWI